jgi:hypothetical protein
MVRMWATCGGGYVIVRKPSEQARLCSVSGCCCFLNWSYGGRCCAWMGAGVTMTVAVTAHTSSASPSGWNCSVVVKKRHDFVE